MILTNQYMVADQFNKFFWNVALGLIPRASSVTKIIFHLKDPKITTCRGKRNKLKRSGSKEFRDIFEIFVKLLQITLNKKFKLLTLIFIDLPRKRGWVCIPETKYGNCIFNSFKDPNIKLSSYRPISVLPMISKIFEKLGRLVSFYNNHEFSWNYQNLAEIASLDILSNFLCP